MRQEGEPSVDQILQSIKRVMARDRRPRAEEGAGDAPPAADFETGAQEPDELTAEALSPAEAEELMADPDGERVVVETDTIEVVAEETLEPAIEAEPADDRQADLPAEAADETAADAAQSDAEQSEAPEADTSLTSGEAGESMRRSLAALAMLAQPGAPLPTSAAGAASLDAMVRELLRPMLGQWLDTHLPAIVEREVKAEIARITGGG